MSSFISPVVVASGQGLALSLLLSEGASERGEDNPIKGKMVEFFLTVTFYF